MTWALNRHRAPPGRPSAVHGSCKWHWNSKFHGNSFLVASSRQPRDILVRMSLTCREEIGRVGRVGRGCYKDASDSSTTRRACRARGIWRTTRHTDTIVHRSRSPVDQSESDKRVASWKGKVARYARHARHPRSILARMSGVSARMS